MAILYLIIGLILFVGLVVIHEFGHFVMARRNGVEIEEFGIGFPPAFYKKRIKSAKGDYDFTLNWLPLGGFVRLKGENDAADETGTFGAASLKAKVKIMVAGVVMNLVVALVLLTAIAAIGMPKLITPASLGEDQFTVASDTKVVKQEVKINLVEANSPASKTGLMTGDKLTGYGNPESPAGALKPFAGVIIQDITKQFAGQPLRLAYERDGRMAQTIVQLRSTAEVEASQKTSNPKGYLGVGTYESIVQRSTWSSPVVALGLTAQLTKLTIQGLGKALAGLGGTIAGAVTGNTPARQAAQTAASEQVSGPVGIYFILKEGAKQGIVFILFITALISLTLAIMNILPIPALDGGRLFVTLLYRVIRRPLTARAEELIHGTGMLVLLVLFALITVVDVKRFF